MEASAEVFRGRRIVVFGGRDAAPLAERLRAAGADVVRVEAGDGFRDAGAYLTVRPAAHEDYAPLARSLADRGWAGKTHTLHLWSLDETGSTVDLAAAERGLERGLGALLHWAQAQTAAGLLGEGSTLLGATRGAQAVLGGEDLRPWQAPLAGAAEDGGAGARRRPLPRRGRGGARVGGRRAGRGGVPAGGRRPRSRRSRTAAGGAGRPFTRPSRRTRARSRAWGCARAASTW